MTPPHQKKPFWVRLCQQHLHTSRKFGYNSENKTVVNSSLACILV